MPTINTLIKIEKYLKSKNEACTYSDISRTCGLKYSAVKKACEYLSGLNRIIIFSNNKTNLVKWNLIDIKNKFLENKKH